MKPFKICLLISIIGFMCLGASNKTKTPEIADIMGSLTDEDWRDLDPEKTLYMKLAKGMVVIELAPLFAPKHFANIQKLAKENYWDGLAILRSQDNYVVQWGDPNGDNPKKLKKIKTAQLKLPPEFEQKVMNKWHWTPLEDSDVYANKVGFVDGFYVGRDSKKFWMLHCYGTVGVSRDMAPDSGNGSSLYAVIGHSPRHLDRNITLVGRVVYGIEHLSTLPRGTGPLGFYEKPQQYTKIESVRLASDLPKEKRLHLQVLKTDSQAFRQLLEARRNRQEKWFHRPAGHLEICNAPIPVQLKGKVK